MFHISHSILIIDTFRIFFNSFFAFFLEMREKKENIFSADVNIGVLARNDTFSFFSSFCLLLFYGKQLFCSSLKTRRNSDGHHEQNEINIYEMIDRSHQFQSPFQDSDFQPNETNWNETKWEIRVSAHRTHYKQQVISTFHWISDERIVRMFQSNSKINVPIHWFCYFKIRFRVDKMKTENENRNAPQIYQ